MSGSFLYYVMYLAIVVMLGDINSAQATRGRSDPSRTEIQSMISDNDWENAHESYSTPSTPRPQDVNCHVEVPTTETIGGRCVRFGSANNSVYACQAGVHTRLNPDCEIMFTSRRLPRRRAGQRQPRTRK